MPSDEVMFQDKIDQEIRIAELLPDLAIRAETAIVGEVIAIDPVECVGVGPAAGAAEFHHLGNDDVGRRIR